jgi:hypothetical protein
MLSAGAVSARWPAYPSIASSPQQEDGWSAITSPEGVLFVWNVHGLYFTLTLKGKNIKPLDDPEHIFFNVDERILQIQVAALKEFVPEARQKKLDDRMILAAHRDWESKYIGELIKSPLKVQTFNARLSNGDEALMWQFDMPEGLNTEAKKQLYVTVVKNDYVLMLNSEATATTADADGRKFLLETLATYKASPTPIDVKALAESIRKGSSP